MRRVGAYAAGQPGSLKEAQQALIAACGGLDRAASICAGMVGRSQLARYQSAAEEHETISMPMLVVDRLEAECGQPVVTAWFAHRRGGLFVQLPKGRPEPYLKHLCDISRKTGEMFARAHSALADGVVTPKEAGIWRREAMRLSCALGFLLGRLDQVIDSGKADR